MIFLLTSLTRSGVSCFLVGWLQRLWLSQALAYHHRPRLTAAAEAAERAGGGAVIADGAVADGVIVGDGAAGEGIGGGAAVGTIIGTVADTRASSLSSRCARMPSGLPRGGPLVH